MKVLYPYALLSICFSLYLAIVSAGDDALLVECANSINPCQAEFLAERGVSNEDMSVSQCFPCFTLSSLVNSWILARSSCPLCSLERETITFQSEKEKKN